MEKMIFGAVLLVWAACGVIGVMRCKNEGVNWWMIGFSAAVPFIPLVAKLLRIP